MYDQSLSIDIGINDEDRRAIAHRLFRLLPDTCTLYLKTHNFHRNVTGPVFNTLHLMFEQQYNELAPAVDAVAERSRALGEPAPGSYTQFAELTAIREESGVPSATEVLRQLVADQGAVVRTAREIFSGGDRANDEPTADLLTQRMQIHENTARTMRSMLQ